MSVPRQQLESWVGTLSIKADRVLDVGGSQKPVNKRVREWEVKEYIIADLETPHDNSPKPDVIVNIGGEMTEEFRKNIIRSNVLFCLEVMEYVFDPVKALKNMNALLEEDGLLYISFNFNYPVHNPIGLDYLRYTRFGVEKLLKETGFEILQLEPRVCSMKDGYPELMSFYSKQGMKYAKDYPYHSDTGYLVKAKKI